jgi:cysteine sulfinate desulfinase/cysteine desulfurase-like protein
MPQVKILRDRFWEGLRGILGEKVTLNGHPTARLPNTLNYCFSEEEYLEQDPEERLRRQFMGDPLWNKG